MSEWIKFAVTEFNPFTEKNPPYNGEAFLACIWGRWVGMAIYARHYDTPENKMAAKYEFFYVTQDAEKEGWKIPIETDPFPITHWMRLPTLPEQEDL